MVAVRNYLFDTAFLKARKLKVPVFSIGNIAMGGVGKTPIVRSLAQKLLVEGRRPAVSLRGYKGDVPKAGVHVTERETFASGAPAGAVKELFLGDEAALYRRLLPSTPLLVGASRFRVASDYLQSSLPSIDCLLVDDGFQHRWLHRDFDVVVLPVSQKNFSLFPLGLNRESQTALKRASAIFWMHDSSDTFNGRKVNPEVSVEALGDLKQIHCLKKVSRVSTPLDGLSGGQDLPKQSSYTLACALGNNAQVAETLHTAGYSWPAQKLFLQDHAKMNSSHRAKIDSWGLPVVTTWKDYLRQPAFFGGLQAVVFIIEIEILWSEDPLLLLPLGK